MRERAFENKTYTTYDFNVGPWDSHITNYSKEKFNKFIVSIQKLYDYFLFEVKNLRETSK